MIHASDSVTLPYINLDGLNIWLFLFYLKSFNYPPSNNICLFIFPLDPTIKKEVHDIFE